LVKIQARNFRQIQQMQMAIIAVISLESAGQLFRRRPN
jgi:hypothetical protein